LKRGICNKIFSFYFFFWWPKINAFFFWGGGGGGGFKKLKKIYIFFGKNAILPGKFHQIFDITKLIEKKALVRMRKFTTK
jgi:hypothetical protein